MSMFLMFITETSFLYFFVNCFYMILLLALCLVYPITNVTFKLLSRSVFPFMGLHFLFGLCAIWTISIFTVEPPNTLMDVFDVPIPFALCCKCLFTKITLMIFCTDKSSMYIFDVTVFVRGRCKKKQK